MSFFFHLFQEVALLTSSKCPLVELLGAQNWNMRADLSTEALPVLTDVGPAVNIDYKLTVVYPSCHNYVYLIVDGAFGRLVKLTHNKRW